MNSMMFRAFSTLAAVGLASPAVAATGPFLSLSNSDFVVLIAFVVFLGILAYYKVPGMLSGLLDQRAESIRSEIDEAKALQEEARALLADYERKQKEVQDQADRIVAQAKQEAQSAADAAKENLKTSIARRLAAAEEQIAAAEGQAVREVRDQAIAVAIAAARDVIAKKMTEEDGARLIDEAIETVEAKLH